MASVESLHTQFPYFVADNAAAANNTFDEMCALEKVLQCQDSGVEDWDRSEILQIFLDCQAKFDWYMDLTSVWLKREGYEPQGLKS